MEEFRLMARSATTGVFFRMERFDGTWWPT
jgi:hypothetical protein